jgi:hypothetical protein
MQVSQVALFGFVVQNVKAFLNEPIHHILHRQSESSTKIKGSGLDDSEKNTI